MLFVVKDDVWWYNISIFLFERGMNMSELYFEIREAEEGGYIARALGQSIFTEADTYEEIKINIKDAVVCHFEEKDIPKLIRLHFVRDELLVV